jgi:hypothetical protein
MVHACIVDAQNPVSDSNTTFPKLSKIVKQAERVKTRVVGRVISKNYRDPPFKERKKDRNWVRHFRTAETWILVRLK